MFATLALAEGLLTLFLQWRLVGSADLRDLVVEACVPLEDGLLGLPLEESLLTHILGAKYTPAYLLEQQKTPVCERHRGWKLCENLTTGGILTQQGSVGGFPVFINFTLGDGLTTLGAAHILRCPRLR